MIIDLNQGPIGACPDCGSVHPKDSSAEQLLLGVLSDALKASDPKLQVSIIPPSHAVLAALSNGHEAVMRELNKALLGKWPPVRIKAMSSSPSALKAIDFTSAVAMIMLMYAPDFDTLADRLPPLKSLEAGVWEHAGRRYVWDKKSKSLLSASIY